LDRKEEWAKERDERMRKERIRKTGFVMLIYYLSHVYDSGGPGLVALSQEERDSMLSGLMDSTN
jgi:hypothetical protein